MTDHKTLAAALAAFQAELPKFGKDGANPHFKSKYVTLEAVTAAVLPALGKQGLSWVTMPTTTEQGFALHYELLHVSGEKLVGDYPLPTGKPQDVGSAITYARRYTLSAVTGVAADEDDDGNAAQNTTPAGPPDGWRGLIANAATLADLTKIHTRAVAERWATPDVMKSLTARKEELAEVPGE